MDDFYQAVVEKIIPSGKHGPYAVARHEDEAIGVITFSLDAKVWQEKQYPEPGTIVVLSEVCKKRAGWRAMNGRFLKPSDQHPSRKQRRKEQ